MGVNLPNFMRAQGDIVYLSLKVQPRASRTEIAEVLGAELKVKVAAPPVDAAANEALVRFLADTLDCPRSAVQLVKGQTSRHKTIAVHGLPAQHVAARLIPNVE